MNWLMGTQKQNSHEFLQNHACKCMNVYMVYVRAYGNTVTGYVRIRQNHACLCMNAYMVYVWANGPTVTGYVRIWRNHTCMWMNAYMVYVRANGRTVQGHVRIQAQSRMYLHERIYGVCMGSWEHSKRIRAY